MKEELRFRHIHLDFHTSEEIPDIAADFDPDEFADTLKRAHVNSINMFARGHHGWIYYDTKRFPERIHPHTKNRNLLKEQIEACHKRDIKAPIYVTIQWDQYTAEHHPEWLTITPEGKQEGTGPYEAGFYRYLCVNTPYVDFLREHVREICETLPVDGWWFDIVQARDCSCAYCRRMMLEAGLDPHDAASRKRFGVESINRFKRDMTKFVRQFHKDSTIFYNAGHVSVENRDIKDAYTHFELESLPSGGWGYMHFPITMRYARTLGLPCLGMTGKFHTMWGDFHSFKNLPALEFECFRTLALNGTICVGDQLPPRGKICKDTYELIGKVYAQVEQKEPWCKKARPLVDIGVFNIEEFTKIDGPINRLPGSLDGATRMLQEGAHQFDLIDSETDFSNYKLLVMPDEIPVSKALARKIEQYVKKGGAVIATFESGMNEDRTEFGLGCLGVTLKSEGPRDMEGQLARGRWYPEHNYVDYVIPRGKLGKGLPSTEHVMYIRGTDIKAEKGTEVLMKRIAPYFDRTYRHFCSHRQTPSSGKAAGPAVVKNGNVIYFSHPIFTTYQMTAPLWCKKFMLNAIDLLLAEPRVRHDGPSSLMVTLNEQPKDNRLVLHLLNYVPEHRSTLVDVVEEVLPCYNLSVSVAVDKKIKKVQCVPGGADLKFESKDGRVAFAVETLCGHQMVVISF